MHPGTFQVKVKDDKGLQSYWLRDLATLIAILSLSYPGVVLEDAMGIFLNSISTIYSNYIVVISSNSSPNFVTGIPL